MIMRKTMRPGNGPLPFTLVQEGVEAVLGQDHRTLSVIRSPRRSGRPISDPQLSDEDQKALMIVLDSLVTRSKVSRVMAEL